MAFLIGILQGRNDRVVKSVEPSYNSTTTSRNFRVSSPTFKDVGYSSKVINSSKQIETNKKNAPVLNNSNASNRGFTSTWRSPVSHRNFSFTGSWSSCNIRSTFSNIRR